MKEQDMVQVDRITLEKIQFGIQQMMSKSLMDEMRYESREDIETRTFIKQLTFYLWGNKVNVEKYDTEKVYPATMWEELKRDFWPIWLRRMFPVRYSRDVTHHKEIHWHVCPHLNCKDDRKHLNFMMLNDTKLTVEDWKVHKGKIEGAIKDYLGQLSRVI
uniref:Uncharacterized protein n=1 Tax=viral metagenome TaxID=1070528 RepID=A0A6M3KV41_9ZZZZ